MNSDDRFSLLEAKSETLANDHESRRTGFWVLDLPCETRHQVGHLPPDVRKRGVHNSGKPIPRDRPVANQKDGVILRRRMSPSRGRLAQSHLVWALCSCRVCPVRHDHFVGARHPSRPRVHPQGTRCARPVTSAYTRGMLAGRRKRARGYSGVPSGPAWVSHPPAADEALPFIFRWAASRARG